jgi:demethylmenaquinone methyltransferase/2-methoxy-6-polyprenyl-1,4-benzoquinol methylase
VGSDFSEGMLARARAKAASRELAGAQLSFQWADALALPYDDDAFDAATVGFGARNFSDLARGLAEMARVVRPGGRVVVLEITTPSKPPLSLFYAVWFDRVVPLLGRAAQLLGRPLRALGPLRRGRDGSGAGSSIADAYTYLPNSVKRFPGPVQLAAELQRAGLQEIRYVLLAGGIVAIHSATVGAGGNA